MLWLWRRRGQAAASNPLPFLTDSCMSSPGLPSQLCATAAQFTHAPLKKRRPLTCPAAAQLSCPAGVKQNYARRCHIPIDAITFDYTCMSPDMHPEAAPAEGGAYVGGMFVEGARWDPETAQLAESQPKVRRLHCCCCCWCCTCPQLSWALHSCHENKGLAASLRSGGTAGSSVACV